MGLYGRSSPFALSSPLLYLRTYPYVYIPLSPMLFVRFCRSFSLLLIFGYTLGSSCNTAAVETRARLDLGDKFSSQAGGHFFFADRAAPSNKHEIMRFVR